MDLYHNVPECIRIFLSPAGADNVNFESIRSEQDAAGTVYVSWAEPANPNGVILYYVLRYRRAEQAPALKASANKAPIMQQNKSEVNGSA